jgi:hypothetical protein
MIHVTAQVCQDLLTQLASARERTDELFRIVRSLGENPCGSAGSHQDQPKGLRLDLERGVRDPGGILVGNEVTIALEVQCVKA